MIEPVRLAAWAAFGVLFGVFSWTDLPAKKVRNGAICGALAAAFAGYAALAFWTWRAEGRFLSWPFYGAAFSHAAAAWAAGLGLWLLRLWPAEDARLFMTLGALFPLLAPQALLGPWRLALSTLLNCFILAALASGVTSLLKGRGKRVSGWEDILEWKAESIAPFLVLSTHSLEVIARDLDFHEKYFKTAYANRLTRPQAKLLKAWCAVNGVPSLGMQRTLSLATWVFAGYALTVWLQGDLISALAGWDS